MSMEHRYLFRRMTRKYDDDEIYTSNNNNNIGEIYVSFLSSTKKSINSVLRIYRFDSIWDEKVSNFTRSDAPFL